MRGYTTADKITVKKCYEDRILIVVNSQQELDYVISTLNPTLPRLLSVGFPNVVRIFPMFKLPLSDFLNVSLLFGSFYYDDGKMKSIHYNSISTNIQRAYKDQKVSGIINYSDLNTPHRISLERKEYLSKLINDL